MENEIQTENLSVDEKVSLVLEMMKQTSKGSRKKKTDKSEQKEMVESSAPSVPYSVERKMSKRTRKFSCSTYISPKALEKFLKGSPFIQHWAYCSHDKDISENAQGDKIIDMETGEPIFKEFHTHFLLYTYEAKSSSAVRKIFDRYSTDVYSGEGQVMQNTFVEPCNDMVSQWRYLIHADNPEKALYHPDERICDDVVYWGHLEKTNGLNDANDNKYHHILQDVMRGMSPFELSQKYGYAYIANVQKFDYLIRKIDMFSHLQRGLTLKECFQFGLANSTYSQEDLNKFFIMFDYLQSDIFLYTGVNIDKIPLNQYLSLSKEIKNTCLK